MQECFWKSSNLWTIANYWNEWVQQHVFCKRWKGAGAGAGREEAEGNGKNLKTPTFESKIYITWKKPNQTYAFNFYNEFTFEMRREKYIFLKWFTENQ